MQPKQLSELQQTIKELQKLGTFSDEELQWLGDMDKSMDELSKEIAHEKLHIAFVNHGNHPDPTFDGDMVTLKMYLPSEFSFKPMDRVDLDTGIEIMLPDNLTLSVTQSPTLYDLGIAAITHSNPKHLKVKTLSIRMFNFNPHPVFLSGVQHIADVHFNYFLSNAHVELRPFQS